LKTSLAFDPVFPAINVNHEVNDGPDQALGRCAVDETMTRRWKKRTDG
jgi:hypothetical protein